MHFIFYHIDLELNNLTLYKFKADEFDKIH